MAQAGRQRPLTLVAGNRSLTPCSHETLQRLQLWIARELTPGTVEVHQSGAVCISHIDDTARACFPHLLNPCECGTYLPLADVPPGPMVSSALHLQNELERLLPHRDRMSDDMQALFDALCEMTRHCLNAHLPLEMR